MKVLFIDPAHYHDQVRYIQALRQAGLEVIVQDGNTDVFPPEKITNFIHDSKFLHEIDLVITEHLVPTPTDWDPKACEYGTRTAHEVIRHVHTTRPELPIIILTLINDQGERERNRQLPNVYFCQKQETTPAQLVELVRQILGQTV